MKTINYSFLRVIGALILGLLLVMFPDQAVNYLVITVGVVFLVPSLVSLIGYFSQRAEVCGRFPIEGVGSLLFGLWLMVMPGFFADLLTLVLGFILALGGIQQIATLLAARRWTTVRVGFFVVPVLIFVAGVVAVFNPMSARSTAFMLIGIGCMVYAFSELLNWFKFVKSRPVEVKPEANGVWTTKETGANKSNVEDAVIIEEE